MNTLADLDAQIEETDALCDELLRKYEELTKVLEKTIHEADQVSKSFDLNTAHLKSLLKQRETLEYKET